MSNTLFRSQAVQASMHTTQGAGIFHQPLTITTMVSLLTLVFILFVLFALFGKMTETQRIIGYLAPIQGEVKIYPGRAGTVHELHVTEGQLIRAGDVLATIRDSRFIESGENASERLLEQLDNQLVLLEEQAELALRKSQTQEISLQRLLASQLLALKLLSHQQHFIESRLDLVEESHQSARTLYQRGVISHADYNLALSQLYALRQETHAGQLQVSARTEAVAETEQLLIAHPLSVQEDVLLLRSRSAQLLLQRAEIESSGSAAVVSPVDGMVVNLLADPGQHADVRIPLMMVVAPDSRLEARLFMPSRALARVEEGQELVLLLDAFPYQIYGTYSATISRIGESTIDPREHLIPLDLQEPVYPVRAYLHASSSPSQNPHLLRAGMHLSAEIVIGHKTILERIFSPFASLRRRL